MKRALFISFLFIPLFAWAQDDSNPTLLGVQLRTRPDYDGSKDQVLDVIPVVRYYGKTLFARTTQGLLEGGARWELTPGLALGAQVAYEAAGKTLDWGASVGAHVEWDTKIGPAPFNLLARYRQNVDSDRGAEADLRANLGIYGGGPWQAGVFTQATWGSSKWSSAYYGVSGGGLAYLSAGLLGSYELSRQWLIVGSAEARSLQGDIKDSAIVDRRTGYYVSGGVAYRF